MSLYRERKKIWKKFVKNFVRSNLPFKQIKYPYDYLVRKHMYDKISSYYGVENWYYGLVRKQDRFKK